MKIRKIGAGVALLTAAALTLTACGAPNNTGNTGSAGSLNGQLSAAGASAQEAAMTAWINGYKAKESGVTVQYNPVGSGNGRKNFLAGQVAFAGSDSAMKTEEWNDSKKICGTNGAFHIPAYINSIAIAYNLKGVDKPVQMDAATVAKIMKGDIKNWNDPAIAAHNPGVKLPDLKITVVHRSDESGTTKNFTEYLNKAASSVWTDEASEDWPIKGQESAQGTQGVVQLITKTEGAIGYADDSATGELGKVSVKVGDSYVAPSVEAAAKAVETSDRVGGMSDKDMAVKIKRDTTEAGAYPVILVSYHIYCNSYKDENTAKMVKSFASYVVSEEGQKTANAAAHNAPMSEKLRTEAKAAIDAITVG